MRRKPLLAAFILLCCPAAMLFAQRAAPPPAKTPGDALVFSVRIVERDLVSAAGAMPADKYDFAPASGEFKGVRTFAQEIKHVAAANYRFGSILAGEKPPRETGGENGPDALKSKAEIFEYLNDSFAYLDNRLGSVTDKNELDQLHSPSGMKVSRLSLASFAVAHPFDRNGQMVEYLRMNGIVPPSSRPRGK